MIGLFSVFQAIALVVASSEKCYYDPLPSIPPSTDNRTVPWGEPTIQYANGTTCCSSLTEVRDQLDTVDAELLKLLSRRCGFEYASIKFSIHRRFRSAYVREATRFKATVTDVNDPSRNAEVIQGAVDGAPAVHLPQIIAQYVYEGIINSSVPFEECVVSTTPLFHYPFLTQRSSTPSKMMISIAAALASVPPEQLSLFRIHYLGQ
jgi:chorismate mutase